MRDVPGYTQDVQRVLAAAEALRSSHERSVTQPPPAAATIKSPLDLVLLSEISTRDSGLAALASRAKSTDDVAVVRAADALSQVLRAESPELSVAFHQSLAAMPELPLREVVLRFAKALARRHVPPVRNAAFWRADGMGLILQWAVYMLAVTSQAAVIAALASWGEGATVFPWGWVPRSDDWTGLSRLLGGEFGRWPTVSWVLLWAAFEVALASLWVPRIAEAARRFPSRNVRDSSVPISWRIDSLHGAWRVVGLALTVVLCGSQVVLCIGSLADWKAFDLWRLLGVGILAVYLMGPILASLGDPARDGPSVPCESRLW